MMMTELNAYYPLDMQFYNPDAIGSQIDGTDFVLFRGNPQNEILGSRSASGGLTLTAGRSFPEALHVEDSQMTFLYENARGGCPEVLLASRTGAICVSTRLFKTCGVFAAVRFPKVHNELIKAAEFCDYAHLAISPKFKSAKDCSPELAALLHEVLYDLHSAFAIGNPGEVQLGGRLSILGQLTGFHSRSIGGYLDYETLFMQAPEVCTAIFAVLQLYAHANLCTEVLKPANDDSTVIPPTPMLVTDTHRTHKKIPPCLLFCQELASSAGLNLTVSITDDKVDPMMKVTLSFKRSDTLHAGYSERTTAHDIILFYSGSEVSAVSDRWNSTESDN